MGAPFGQHFLANPHVAGRIAEALELTPEDTVLEIGPGKGALTRQLLLSGAHVVGIEIDEEMCKKLDGPFRGVAEFRVVQGDVLEVDLNSIFKGVKGPIKVAGNIPYKITSPLLETLTMWPRWDRAVLMVQEEVAKRIAAPPGSKTYSSLSVGVQLVAQTRFLFGLSKQSFRPVPGVDSAVIELIRKTEPLTEPKRAQIMKVVRAAFSQRRKTILNSLSDCLDLPKTQVQESLVAAGIDPGTRAETVDLDGYKRLSDTISKP